ncbi:TonB-dependent receptor [soil metagenome]
MHNNYMLLFFVFIGNYACAQNISGKVLGYGTEEALENVRIVNLNTNESVFSSALGEFSVNIDVFPTRLSFHLARFDTRIITVNNSENLNIYLDPSFQNLSEVIIRGTHLPSELRKIPAAISVISSQDLERIDATNFAQAFNNVPGVYVNQGALNTTKLNIRGIGGRAQYSTNRIQAYFNGFPLTTAEGELTLDDIDPESISRVEVIKGPASSIFGAGLGGVINIYSAEGVPGETKASLNTLFGSYNMTRKLISLSHGSESTSLFVNYSELESDGYRNNGEYDRKSLLASASLETAGGNRLSFLTNFTRLKAFIPSSVNEDTFINSPQSAAFNWEQSRGYESYDQGSLGIAYLHSFGSNFSNTTSVYLNFRDGFEPRPFNILKEERISAGVRSRFNLETLLLERSSRFSFGAEYYREWYETGTFENLYQQFENSGSVLGSRLSNNEQDRNYTNVFGQMEMELSAKLKIEAGINLNITQYSLTDLYAENTVDQSGDYSFNTIFSPRVGASYEIGPGRNIYTSVSHGFSTPTVAETLTPEGQINTALLPETGINYEIGFKGNWFNNKLYTEVAAYSIQVKDLLVAQRVAEDQYVGRNAGKTSHNGIELLLNYSFTPVPNLRIRPYINASFNFFEFAEFVDRDRDFSGNYLPGIPRSTINFGVDAALRNLSLYTNFLTVGEIPLNDGNTIFTNPYNLLNIKGTYKWDILGDLAVLLTGGINNVLDEKYAASVLTNAVGFGNTAPRYYYPGNPRNYYAGLGLNYRF